MSLSKIHLHVYVYTYIYTGNVFTCICIYIYLYWYMSLSLARRFFCICFSNLDTCLKYVCTYMYIHICIHVYYPTTIRIVLYLFLESLYEFGNDMHVYVYTYMSARIYVFIYMHEYMYAYLYTIYTYI